VHGIKLRPFSLETTPADLNRKEGKMLLLPVLGELKDWRRPTASTYLSEDGVS
jgi:hypothetical protein